MKFEIYNAYRDKGEMTVAVPRVGETMSSDSRDYIVEDIRYWVSSPDKPIHSITVICRKK